MRYIYDSCATLQCHPFPHLNKVIGVRAGHVFAHHELGGALHVDVWRDTVTVNTQQAVLCTPAESVNDAIAQMTQETIANLDTVITELTEHRDRLHRELRPRHQD